MTCATVCVAALARGPVGGLVARQLGHDARITLKTHGHVIDELEDAPQVPAEEAILAARRQPCADLQPVPQSPDCSAARIRVMVCRGLLGLWSALRAARTSGGAAPWPHRSGVLACVAASSAAVSAPVAGRANVVSRCGCTLESVRRFSRGAPARPPPTCVRLCGASGGRGVLWVSTMCAGSGTRVWAISSLVLPWLARRAIRSSNAVAAVQAWRS